MILRTPALILACFALSLFQNALALEQSVKGNLPYQSTNGNYNSNSAHTPGSFFFPLATEVTGLQKFHPSVGV